MLLVPLAAAAQEATPTQTDAPPPEVPKFRAESRQLIVEAKVWSYVDKKSAGDTSVAPLLAGGLLDHEAKWARTLNSLRLPPPAPGLTPQDFQVFDSGVEQRINYFKEADFPAVWGFTALWRLSPTSRGVWGFPYLPVSGFPYTHSATYLIGYVPLGLKPGECRTIQIVVPNHYVQANRKQYCAPNASETARTPEETELDARMLRFASREPCCGCGSLVRLLQLLPCASNIEGDASDGGRSN